MGCCISEVEDVVKVSGPKVMLFDVLAVVDALGALFTAAAVLGFFFAGDENLDFSRTCVEAGATGFPGAAGNAAGSAAAIARSFP